MLHFTSLILIVWIIVEFGKNLSARRKERQLTQSELTNLLDIQPRLIGRWEQKKGKPRFDYILKLADTLEISLDWLLRDDYVATAVQFEIRNWRLEELCKQINQLRQKNQDLVCKFLAMVFCKEHIKRSMSETI